ncbi:MAG: PLP-dependent aminotransferase family protein [Tyzzerella sp.]|nr:PLP-dependent aminotransferase family protein [Tyzzerella sp.]
MKMILENEDIPRYLRVYDYYKELILNGQMQPGTKIPSIRKGSKQFQMSRTTMESAYLLLAAEGYIISKPQSGYYVTDIAEKQKKRVSAPNVQKSKKQQKIIYDFVTSNVDRDSFRFELWRRYMKSALRQDERLLSYGEPQGEQDFREVLCKYLQKERSVVCTPEQIVIGAGVQSLLNILCPLVSERKKVAFYNPEFMQGRAVFEDYGYEITAGYEEEGTGLYYISPSQMTKWGGVMTITERLTLIGEAHKRDFLIIEDDYNSEFRYFQKPTPSLQGLAGGRGVVYLGTFSKMLLPSIRMSFMVLPPELLEAYEKRRNMYNQTASKAEQIAITQFIRDGHLSSQIRKSRKIHLAKATELARVIQEVLQEKAETEIGESGFHVYVRLKTECTAAELAERALGKGLAVLPEPKRVEIKESESHEIKLQKVELQRVEVQGKGGAVIMLNCANVAVEEYEAAMELLKECL